MKPIAVISDTHRGVKERLAQSPALESFLAYAKANYLKLIYNGDIVDLWKVSSQEAMDTDTQTIVALASYPDYLWLPGNHDSDAGAMRRMGFKIPEDYKFFARVGTRLIFHGYQLDSLLDSEYEREQAAFLDRVGYDLRDFGFLNYIRSMIDHAHRDNRELDFRSKSWGPVVTGHTHLAEVDDDGRFINDGCVTGEEPMHYVALDWEGNAELIEWKG